MNPLLHAPPDCTVVPGSALYRIFETHGSLVCYRKDEPLHDAGDPATHLYLVKTGEIRSFLLSPEGAQVTLEILRPGNIFGEASCFTDTPRPTSGSAISESTVFQITREALSQWLTPEAMKEILRLMGQTINLLSAQVNAMAFLAAEGKVAHILVSLAGKDQSLFYTHQQIADLLGLSRVTVSRAVGAFTKNGWVAQEYGRVRVLDREALLRHALGLYAL